MVQIYFKLNPIFIKEDRIDVKNRSFHPPLSSLLFPHYCCPAYRAPQTLPVISLQSQLAPPSLAGLVLMLKAKKVDLYTGRGTESPFLSQTLPAVGLPSEFRQAKNRPKLFL